MANIAIHFSDFFDLKNNELKQYGAFDVSLTFDIPVLLTPFDSMLAKRKNTTRFTKESFAICVSCEITVRTMHKYQSDS
jgi:hypothetical protein